jgi:hypothetical protein
MGIFGPSFFENDGAADFVEELSSSNVASRSRAALDRYLEFVEPDRDVVPSEEAMDSSIKRNLALYRSDQEKGHKSSWTSEEDVERKTRLYFSSAAYQRQFHGPVEAALVACEMIAIALGRPPERRSPYEPEHFPSKRTAQSLRDRARAVLMKARASRRFKEALESHGWHETFNELMNDLDARLAGAETPAPTPGRRRTIP